MTSRDEPQDVCDGTEAMQPRQVLVGLCYMGSGWMSGYEEPDPMNLRESRRGVDQERKGVVGPVREGTPVRNWTGK